MRLLSQSTRTTIRTLTLLFALTSLLLTMMTPFVGTANATHDNSAEGFFTFELGGVTHTVAFHESTAPPGGPNITIPGYAWNGEDGSGGPEFHVSCSEQLLNTTADVTDSTAEHEPPIPFDTGDTVTIVNFSVTWNNGQVIHECEPDSFVDLEVEKTGPTEVTPGSGFDFEITVSNIAEQGTAPAENVVLTDEVPAPLDVTNVSPDDKCDFANNTVTCNIGTLEQGESFVATITVSVPASAPCEPVDNLAVASASNGLSDNDSHEVSITDCPGRLIIEKLVEGGNDFETAFVGTATIGDTVLTTDPLGHDGSHTFDDVEPGTYTIGETLDDTTLVAGGDFVDGWQLTSIVCDDVEGAEVTVETGQTVTCVLTNTPDLPTITLEKIVEGDDIEKSDFQATLDGGNVDWGAATQVLPSVDHTIAEALAEGSDVQDSWYDASDWSCDNEDTGAANGTAVTVGLGDHVTCTITNTQAPTTLTLHKILPNDNGGTATQDEFQAYIDDDKVDWDVAYDVSALVEHTASEDTLPGYTPGSWTGDCAADGTVTLAPGESGSCTITNDDDTPTVTVVKEIITDNGGDLTVEEVVLLVDGQQLSSGDTVAVEAHTDVVVGEEPPGGYVLQSITCDDGTQLEGENLTVTLNLDEGEDVTCTVVNDDLPPAVTIVKEVTNDDGGDTQPGEFELLLDGAPVVSGESNETTSNEPHVVSETQIQGYAQISLNCVDDSTEGEVEHPVVLDEGQTVTCTIVNDDLPPGLTVFKNVVNDDEGTAGPEDFTLLVNGDEFSHGDTIDVEANTDYTVSEELLDDYELVDIECTDGTTLEEGESTVVVNLDNDESVGCTITNDDVPPVVIVGEPLIAGTVVPVCDADAAYLNYEAFTQNVDGETVTIHWFDADGVEQHTDVVESLSGQVLWPGAEVDEDGFATDWPGFVFDGEVWEEGDDGFGWANGEVTVTLEVNPTTDPLTATYPSDADAAAGEDCLPPEIEVAGQQFEQPAPAAEELPRTGLDTARMALWAALLAGLGALILLATDTPTATVRQRR